MVAAPWTPAFSNRGAKARPVAGPPVRVTDPARTPNRGLSPKGREISAPRTFLKDGRDRRDDEEKEDLGASDLEEPEAGPKTDRREKGDHERITQRRVKSEQAQVEMSGDENGEGDDQAPNDGRRDVITERGLIQRQRP